MMEQKSNVDESSRSRASKRRKRHSTPSDDKPQHLTTITYTSLESDVVLNGLESLSKQQTSAADQQPVQKYINGTEIYNFILPSEKDCLVPTRI